jgi:hypothetical protein
MTAAFSPGVFAAPVPVKVVMAEVVLLVRVVAVMPPAAQGPNPTV